MQFGQRGGEQFLAVREGLGVEFGDANALAVGIAAKSGVGAADVAGENHSSGTVGNVLAGSA